MRASRACSRRPMVGWLSFRRLAAALRDPSAAMAANRRKSSQSGGNLFIIVWNISKLFECRSDYGWISVGAVEDRHGSCIRALVRPVLGRCSPRGLSATKRRSAPQDRGGTPAGLSVAGTRLSAAEPARRGFERLSELVHSASAADRLSLLAPKARRLKNVDGFANFFFPRVRPGLARRRAAELGLPAHGPPAAFGRGIIGPSAP